MKMQKIFLNGQYEIRMNIQYDTVKAESSDLSMVKALLNSHSLPTEDIGTSNIIFYLINEGEGLKACAGVERFGEVGLLRSVAVKDESRGKGIGSKLIKLVLEQSKGDGIETLFLLTETAESFFSKIGFKKIDRSKAPELIKHSNEFAELCPVSAVLMRKVL